MAFIIGLSLDDFFKMTPWQFKVCVNGYAKKKENDHDHAAWIMYHGAALTRVKKLPELKQFLSSAKVQTTSQGINERAILERLKAYSKRVKNGETS